ncbi:MAG: hypothetical protein OXI54_14585 [Chloroflexota bacterium]|nr:hypothetical protein [Chloroflexota bacterium]MDE2685353.1 hypothetical protein [Chloroflexota bacterium]
MIAQPDADHPYPPNPIADAAWEIYETELRQKLEPEHYGELVFIDTKSHDYEIEDEHGGAWVHLTDRHPDAICYAYRIGYPIWWTREVLPGDELLADAEANPLPKPSPEEMAQRKQRADQARALFKKICSQLSAGERGKVIALDLETGDYEIDNDGMRAAVHLRDRHPGAYVYSFMIGRERRWTGLKRRSE